MSILKLVTISVLSSLTMTGVASAATVVMPARTQIVLVPDRTFLSSEVAVGHQFDLTVLDPIIANGYVAIADGARAHAHVVSTTPSLRIVFDWMRASRQKIILDGTPYEVRAKAADGTGHPYFFGLFHKRSAEKPTIARNSPLEALTAKTVRVWTDVRASTAQRYATVRNLFE